MGGNPDAPVNPAWDAWFLKQLVTAELDPVSIGTTFEVA
jgi:hypothetical protein